MSRCPNNLSAWWLWGPNILQNHVTSSLHKPWITDVSSIAPATLVASRAERLQVTGNFPRKAYAYERISPSHVASSRPNTHDHDSMPHIQSSCMTTCNAYSNWRRQVRKEPKITTWRAMFAPNENQSPALGARAFGSHDPLSLMQSCRGDQM